VAGAEVVMVMGEVAPDDAGIIWDIQSVAVIIKGGTGGQPWRGAQGSHGRQS
jgi:hypothetical protein